MNFVNISPYPQSGEPVVTRGTVAERRRLGSYYTPKPLADVLSNWAIRNANDLVLEPSFGGCDFIDSIVDRLAKLGHPNPISNVCGSDIDKFAFQVLRAEYPYVTQKQFLALDFLSLELKDFPCDSFDVVIGNPPYVRHHHMSELQHHHGRRIRGRLLPSLSGQSNLWALFVLHACSFLKKGGRVAWVLPQQFIQTEYARSIKGLITDRFERVTIVSLNEHTFKAEGAWERPVLVFAEGWSSEQANRTRPNTYQVDNVSQISEGLETAKYITPACEWAAELEQQEHSASLGSIASIQIGMVTGDAKFFNFDKAMATRHGVGERYLRFCLTKAALVQGLSIRKDFLQRAFEAGLKSAVLDTTKGVDEHVDRYLRRKSKKEIEDNVTFNKRPVWHQPFQSVQCDAFFTGMSHSGPRMALNPEGLDCTNTLYRIKFKKEDVSASPELVALSVASSFGQLSAELVGKRYASGLLKLEPSDVRKLRVFCKTTKSALLSAGFEAVDNASCLGQFDEATRIADTTLNNLGLLTNTQIS